MTTAAKVLVTDLLRNSYLCWTASPLIPCFIAGDIPARTFAGAIREPFHTELSTKCLSVSEQSWSLQLYTLQGTTEYGNNGSESLIRTLHLLDQLRRSLDPFVAFATEPNPFKHYFSIETNDPVAWDAVDALAVGVGLAQKHGEGELVLFHEP